MKTLFVELIIIVIILGCLIFCSLNSNYKVNVVYEVCYPDTVINYDNNFDCKGPIDEDFYKNGPKVYMSSFRGTNYIKIQPGDWNEFERTTCPIRIISYKELR